MQFISFIAAMMLIVLISQQSIMGLPVDEVSMEKECSEGFKIVEGECMPMNHIPKSNRLLPKRFSKETVAAEEEPLIYNEEPAILLKKEPARKLDGSCAEGWEHGKYGICQKIKWPKSTEFTSEPESDLKEDVEPKPALKKDRKPKLALEEDVEPKPVLKDDRKPKPALEEDVEPKPALKKDRKPKLALEEDVEPKPVLKDDRKPKPALEEDVEPKPALKKDRKPKPALEEDVEPKPVLKDDRKPKSALEEDVESKPVLKEDRKPKPALEEDVEPKPVLKDDRKPKSALEEDVEPKPALKKDRKPKPALEEDVEPKPVLKDDRKPKPALEEDVEPKPVLKDDRKPKSALEEDVEPKPALKEDRKPKPALEEDVEPKPVLKDDRKPKLALEEDAEPKPVLKEDSKPEENLSRCPEGTKHDEQGSCQEILPSSTAKASLNLKSLLKKDGSCPDNYKMAEGKCLYIKPKTKTTLYPDGTTADISDMIRIQPKSGSEGSDMYEKVPILADNSCPEGTEYSEYGFCQRRIRPSNSTPSKKLDGRCPNDFELIDGKCTYKTPTAQDQSSTPKISTSLFTSEATTLTEAPINDRKLFEPMTTSQSVIEMTTPQSAIEMTTFQSVKEMSTPQSVIEMTTAKVSSDEFQSQTTSKPL